MSRSGGLRSLYGWLLIGPFALTLLVFFVYALARAVYFSFTDYNLFSEPQWVGLSNFLAILQDKLFLVALFNTLLFAVIVTLLQTVLALGLAVVIGGNFFGKNVFRVAFYVPAILSSASVTLVFIWFYQKNGFLNGIVSAIVSNQSQLLLFIAAMAFFSLLLLALERIRHVYEAFFSPLRLLLSAALAFVTVLLATSTGLVVGRAGRGVRQLAGNTGIFRPLAAHHVGDRSFRTFTQRCRPSCCCSWRGCKVFPRICTRRPRSMVPADGGSLFTLPCLSWRRSRSLSSRSASLELCRSSTR